MTPTPTPCTQAEPLYQYINTAEFLTTSVVTETKSPERNQLEIARQLSQRKLWCELPEVCVCVSWWVCGLLGVVGDAEYTYLNAK